MNRELELGPGELRGPSRWARTRRRAGWSSGAPQVRDGETPFQSRLLAFLRGRTEVVERLVTERYVHGLSTRDIEAAFTDPP